MGVSISAFTLKGEEFNSKYACPTDSDAEKLGLEVDKTYPANECDDYLSLSFHSYSTLKDYLLFIGNEIEGECFDHYFFAPEGVITNKECQELLATIDENMGKIESITWKEYAFSNYSDYDDKEEFLDNVDHAIMRSYQSEQALMNRRFRILIKVLEFAAGQGGFIDYG